jgi:hypothetical protein
MAKIILYLKGCARNSFQKLQGRSGFIYDVAHFKDATQRHETKEFDLEDFQNRILPDIEKFPSTLRWWPCVTVETEDEEVTRLKAELVTAHDRITELETTTSQPAPADPFAELTGHPAPVGADGVIGPPGIPLTDMKYRQLRELCKERNIAVTGSTTKEEMITMLSAPTEPVATSEPAAA